MISDWVITEFAAALSVKMRMNQLRIEDRAKAAGLFTRLKAESITEVPVTRDNFVAAGRFADQFVHGLRAGDALHGAVAAAHGAMIHKLVRRLAGAAMAFGANAELV